MEHKIAYKTNDGSLKEQVFDDFNEFADLIDNIAGDHYAGVSPTNINVETIYDGIVKQEKVSYGYEPRAEGDINLLTESNQETRE
jgi:hypothetical protein